MVFRIANSVTVIISVMLIFGIFAGVFVYWNQASSGTAYKTLQVEEQGIASQAAPMQPTSKISYIFAGKKEAKVEGNEISYFHDDNLGTHSVVTDSSGAIIGEFSNFPFGEELSSTGDEKYKYTGKELDDTGLYYYGARFYSPEIGRFTQVDPLMTVESNYIYSTNNPMVMNDPTGMVEAEVLTNNMYALNEQTWEPMEYRPITNWLYDPETAERLLNYGRGTKAYANVFGFASNMVVGDVLDAASLGSGFDVTSGDRVNRGVVLAFALVPFANYGQANGALEFGRKLMDDNPVGSALHRQGRKLLSKAESIMESWKKYPGNTFEDLDWAGRKVARRNQLQLEHAAATKAARNAGRLPGRFGRELFELRNSGNSGNAIINWARAHGNMVEVIPGKGDEFRIIAKQTNQQLGTVNFHNNEASRTAAMNVKAQIIRYFGQIR